MSFVNARLLLLLPALPACACGGDGAAPAPSPKAADLLERYVAATGGRPAHERLSNRVTRGNAEIRGFPGHDWTATFVRYEAAPNIWSETLTFGDWENEEGTNGFSSVIFSSRQPSVLQRHTMTRNTCVAPPVLIVMII